MKSLYNFANPIAPTVGRNFGEVEEQSTENVDTSLLADAAMGVPRGVEDFAHSVYNLADYFSFDNLPDWDEQRLFGHSKTWAGELTNGITQFVTGFVPALGVASKIGKVGRISKAAKVAPRAATYGKFAAAGAMSDFVSFEANEQRLSNLVQSFPAFQNPISEYLAATGDDGEIEGRFKNVIEGLILEAGIGSAFEAAKYAKDLKFGVKNIKNQRKMAKVTEDEAGTYDKIFGEYRKDIEDRFAFDDSVTLRENKGEQVEIEVFNNKFKEIASRAFDNGEDTTSVGKVVRRILMSPIANESRYTPMITKLYRDHYDELENVKFKLVDTLDDARGTFDENTNTISLLRNDNTVSASRTFAHELVHAVASKKITKHLGKIQELTGEDYYRALTEFANKKVTPETEQIQKLVASYLGVIESDKAYKILSKAQVIDMKDFGPQVLTRGALNDAKTDIFQQLDPSSSANLFNLHEFVSEAMTNPAFARTLNSVASVGGNSLGSQFKQSMKALLLNTDEGTQTVLDDVLTFTNALRTMDLKDIPDGLTGGKVAPERVIDEADNVRSSTEEISKMNPTSTHKSKPLDPDSDDFLTDASVARANLQKEITGLANFLRLGDGKITGGTQAIESAARNIKSTNGAWALIAATARHLDTKGVKKTTTAKELNSVTEEYADILGGDINVMKAHIEKMKNSPEKMAKFRNEQAAAKEIIGTLSRLAVDKAKEIKAHASTIASTSKKDKKVLEGELLSLLDQLTETQRIWSLFGKEAALNLVQRRLLGGRYGFNVRKNVGIDSTQKSTEEVTAFRRQRMSGVVGQMRMNKLVDLLVMADSDRAVTQAMEAKGLTDPDFAAMIKNVTTNNRKSQGNKMFAITMEYWMNSLLSGPSTQIVNLIGNILNATMRQLELIGGAAMSGDMKTARAAIQFAFDTEMMRESVKYATKAFKNDDSILLEGSRVFDDDQFRTYAIQSDRQDAIGGAVNFLGTVVRTPTRALLTGDEFFKQMSYRSNVKTELAMEAMNKGLTDGYQISKYVNERFNDFITDGGHAYSEAAITREAFEKAREAGLGYGNAQADFIRNYKKQHVFDEANGALADRSIEAAKLTTFTQRSNEGVVNKVGNVVGYGLEQLPLMRFVVPFLNTPTNILRSGLERTPLAVGNVIADTTSLLSSKIRKGIHSADPLERARARGKLATATGISAMLYYHIAAGNTKFGKGDSPTDQLITGGGPANPDQKKAMMLSGWRPYSIRIGDKYVSYQRLDPIATAVGLLADMNDARNFDELEPDQLGRMFGIFVSALTNNITSKSYLEGIENVMSAIMDAEHKGAYFLGGIAGGFMPNFINQAQNYQGNRELFEVRNIFDNLLKRTPYAEEIGIPKKRNFLGEVESIENLKYAGPLNPFYLSSVSNDKVDQGLGALKHGFTKPTKKFMNSGLDLTNVYQGKRQAYDRMLELTSTSKIGGKTLRERLRDLMSSEAYKSLPDYNEMRDLGKKTPRINAVQQLISAYRSVALRQTVSEFDELQQAQTDIRNGRLAYLR